MKSRGRKPKIYPKEILLKLVEDLLKTNPHIQIIKYKEIHLYALEKYNKGLLDFKLSEDFWRKTDRQGRILIDEVNKKRNISLEGVDHIQTVSTADIINRLSQDAPAIKKLIVNQLKVNEYGYKKLIDKFQQLKFKGAQMETEIIELKAEIVKLKKNNEIYQNILFQWANISSIKDTGLLNVITTGKTRTETVEQLFKDMFKENPNKAMVDINKDKPSSNVVELQCKIKNTLVEDLDL